MMKSLAEVTQNIQMQESPKNAMSLASRPTPLTVDEIVKIQNAVDKYFTVKNEDPTATSQ